MATNHKIVACVGMLCEAFNRKPTPATFKAFEITLSDIADEQVDSATTVALTSNREFMPTPGQLRELAVTGGVGYAGRAERAWIEFDRAVVREGADHSVSFADGLINATVRLLGDWIFCASKAGDDYGVWLRKQFLETYQRLCMSGAAAHLRQPLVGNYYRENALHHSDEQLAKLNANCGLPVIVATSQPVLLPPTESPKRIDRPADLPRLELKTVNP